MNLFLARRFEETHRIIDRQGLHGKGQGQPESIQLRCLDESPCHFCC